MFLQPYVQKLFDTIISNQPLSYGQLFLLVDFVADYIHDYGFDCDDDFYRIKFSLLERSDYMEGGE